jgi:hypothetical protein
MDFQWPVRRYMASAAMSVGELLRACWWTKPGQKMRSWTVDVVRSLVERSNPRVRKCTLTRHLEAFRDAPPEVINLDRSESGEFHHCWAKNDALSCVNGN